MRTSIIENKKINLSTRKRITGQGMTEYIIIVALIAIAAVSAVGLFGASVKTQFTALATDLVGGTGATAATQAQGVAAAAELTNAAQKTELGTYNN